MKKLLLLFLLFSLRAQAECLSAAHVQEIASIYHQFDADGKVCDTAQPEKFAILKTLLTLQSLKITFASHSSFDISSTPVIPDSWANYLSAHVQRFLPGEKCTADILAYTQVRDPQSRGVIYICPAFVAQTGAGLYDNIATLLHEARHLEFNVDHVTCRDASKAGADPKTLNNGCDESVDQRGSYAVTLQVLAGLSSLSAEINPVAKAAVRASAIATAFERFNNVPNISREQKPLLLTQDGQLQILVKNKVTTLVRDLPAGLLTPYETHFVLYPTGSDGSAEAPLQIDPALLVRRDGNPARALSPGGETWTAEERESIVGIHYGKKISVRLEKSRWTAVCNGQKTSIEMHQDMFKGLIYPNGYSANQTSVFVIDNQDQWGQISCDEQNQASLSWQIPAYTKLNKLMKIGSVTYGLTHSGLLVRLGTREGRRAWIIVSETKSLRFRDLQGFSWVHYKNWPL